MTNTRLKWIGLFEVRPQDSNRQVLGGAAGAFVNVLGLAEESDCFVSMARQHLADSGFEVLNADDVGLISERIERDELIDALLKLVDDLCDETPIIFDEFQAYESIS